MFFMRRLYGSKRENTQSPFFANTTIAVSCAQVFYYFQHYSKKDDRGTKAIV